MISSDLDKIYCGAIRRGDIFLYEHFGEEQVGLVIQEDILNERLPSVVLVQLDKLLPNEVIFKNEVLLPIKHTGLDCDLVGKLYHIHTVTRDKILMKKGRVKNDNLADVFIALDLNLGRFRD